MLRFAANLSFMYGEYAFPDRFAAAARDAFTAVEYLFPYEYPAQQLAAWLQLHGLVQALFNAPPGNWADGRTRAGQPAGPGDGVSRRYTYCH